MTKQLLKVLESLKLYTQIQSKRIDLLEKRLKQLEKENKWNIAKDQIAIPTKPRTAYAVLKAPRHIKLEEDHHSII